MCAQALAAALRSPRGKLFIAALGIGQICSWGSLYYSFPLIAEIQGRDLGWSKPELYGAAALGLALSGLAAYPVGVAIDRGHGRLVMGLGSILAGLLFLAWSQVTNLVAFYVVFAGIGCLQAATLYEPAFAVVARRVGAEHARRGITALTLWGGFASTVFIPFTQILLDHLGWRATVATLGSINIVVCGGLYLAVIEGRADAVPPARRVSGRPSGRRRAALRRAALRRALRTPVFWALAFAFMVYAATFSAFSLHLYPLLLERGLDTLGVVTVMSVIGPAQVAGRILVWVFAPRASVRVLGAVIVSVFPVALGAIALVPPSVLALTTIALVYGAANGVMTIVRGLAVPEMLTPDAYGTINGALAAPALIAQSAAPFAAAALWAATGGYDAVLAAIIAGAVLLALGFWTAAALAQRGGGVGVAGGDVDERRRSDNT